MMHQITAAETPRIPNEKKCSDASDQTEDSGQFSVPSSAVTSPKKRHQEITKTVDFQYRERIFTDDSGGANNDERVQR